MATAVEVPHGKAVAAAMGGGVKPGAAEPPPPMVDRGVGELLNNSWVVQRKNEEGRLIIPGTLVVLS